MRMAKVKHIGTLENWHIEYRGISSVGLEHPDLHRDRSSVRAPLTSQASVAQIKYANG